MPDQATALTLRSSSAHGRQESLSIARRVDPRSVKPSALPYHLQKVSSIPDRRLAKAYASPYRKLALGLDFIALYHAGFERMSNTTFRFSGGAEGHPLQPDVGRPAGT